MCAPRVEEFCFITDNTYTKEEVVKMEKEVLNLLRFQLSVPTTKTFLRYVLLIYYVRKYYLKLHLTKLIYYCLSGDSSKQHNLLTRYYSCYPLSTI